MFSIAVVRLHFLEEITEKSAEKAAGLAHQHFRIYRPYLISELINKKSFFKNEDFNIAVKIILFLINKFQNLKISEYPLILNYHHKMGSSKMKITRNIFFTLKLIVLKKF